MPDDSPVVPGIEHLLGVVSDGVYVTDRFRRIHVWNPAAERITGYGACDAVGRRCRDNLLNHVDEGGRSLCRGVCPLAKTMRDGVPREARVWLKHADGHRVAVEVRCTPVRDESGTIVGGLEVFREVAGGERVAQEISELRELALADALTSLPNRRYGYAEIERRLAALDAVGRPFGLLMADLDDFKGINDARGHAVGDAALRVVGHTLREACRAADTPVRWGGDEFVVLASGDTRALEGIAERIAALVATAEVPGHEDLRLGMSIGVAAARTDDDPDRLLARADAHLYQVKHMRGGGWLDGSAIG